MATKDKSEKFELIPSSESIDKVIKETKLSKENLEVLTKLKDHMEQFGNNDNSSYLVSMSINNYRYSLSSIGEIGKLKREIIELTKTQSFENIKTLIEENTLLKKEIEEIKQSMQVKTFRYFLSRVKTHINNFLKNNK